MKEKPVPHKDSQLTVLWRVEGKRDKNGWRSETWLCQCSCGESAKVTRGRIVSGATKSCGCLRVAKVVQVAAKGRSVYSEQCREKRERGNG